MTAIVAMGENKRCRPVKDLLLPGILDDVVLDKIAPKLEWIDFCILSSVNCAWHNAIRSRRVFDSRVLSHSSGTFVVRCTHDAIALYSMRDNSWHELPRIADICEGRHSILTSAQFIAMDGKIYVLGRKVDSEISNKVFVFDLGGQGRWEQCASMEQQRQNFGTAVMDGKIYVFGGSEFGGRSQTKLRSSEVYEPKEDTWSPIRPMAECDFSGHVIGEELFTCEFFRHVTPIGEELFIFGGYSDLYGFFIHSLEAYHPFKDEWRVVQRSRDQPHGGAVQRSWDQPRGGAVFFTVHGNVFSIETESRDFTLGLDRLSIRKYDVHGYTWIHVCSFSFAGLIPESCRQCATLDAAFAVDDELLALVHCRERKEIGEDGTLRLFLFQSTGFGSENQKISWKLRAFTFEPLLQGHDSGLIPESFAAHYFVQKF